MKNQRSWLLRPQTLGLSAGTPQPVPHLMCSGSSLGSQGSLNLHLVVVVSPPPASLHTSCSFSPIPGSGSRAPLQIRKQGQDAPPPPASFLERMLPALLLLRALSAQRLWLYILCRSKWEKACAECLPPFAFTQPSPHSPGVQQGWRGSIPSSTVHAGPGAPNATEPHWLALVLSPLFTALPSALDESFRGHRMEEIEILVKRAYKIHSPP